MDYDMILHDDAAFIYCAWRNETAGATEPPSSPKEVSGVLSQISSVGNLAATVVLAASGMPSAIDPAMRSLSAALAADTLRSGTREQGVLRWIESSKNMALITEFLLTLVHIPIPTALVHLLGFGDTVEAVEGLSLPTTFRGMFNTLCVGGSYVARLVGVALAVAGVPHALLASSVGLLLKAVYETYHVGKLKKPEGVPAQDAGNKEQEGTSHED